ncbi:MAG: DUF2752 domain-containing protein [Firmicutes bacterium]|nr:DUF2752 domain-containing protein [Bacillota bacterium]
MQESKFTLFLFLSQIFPICIFKNLAGIECPGCGILPSDEPRIISRASAYCDILIQDADQTP